MENDSKHTIEDRKLFLSCINTPTHSGDNKKTRSNTRKEKLYTANNLCIKYNYLDNSQDFLVSSKVKPKHGSNKTLGKIRIHKTYIFNLLFRFQCYSRYK